jgi:hypothetical protein
MQTRSSTRPVRGRRGCRDDRLVARLEQAGESPFAGQRARRRLVGAGAAVLALLWIDTAVCWALAPSDAAMYTTLAVLAVVILAGAWVWGTLFQATRGTVGLPEHLLDERQVRERLSAHATAHRLTAALLLATYFFVVVLMLPKGESSAIPGAALTVLFLSLVATVWALPMLVVAWRLPDPPADDE